MAALYRNIIGPATCANWKISSSERVILSRGAELEVPLAELKQRSTSVATVSRSNGIDGAGTLEHAEREHIVRTLGETKMGIGGPEGAATRLGMKRTTLQSRMRKLGINATALTLRFRLRR